MAVLFHMYKSRQFYLNPTWMLPSRSVCIDVRRLGEFHLEHLDESTQHSNGGYFDLFFYVQPRVWQTRYFNAQQIALDHRVEKERNT